MFTPSNATSHQSIPTTLFADPNHHDSPTINNSTTPTTPSAATTSIDYISSYSTQIRGRGQSSASDDIENNHYGAVDPLLHQSSGNNLMSAMMNNNAAGIFNASGGSGSGSGRFERDVDDLKNKYQFRKKQPMQSSVFSTCF